jgi:hypothetical protein
MALPRVPSPVIGLALAASTLLCAPKVVAQTADPCLSAPIDGQQAQRAGKLIEARASYVSCASQACPKVIVSDCEHWLREVDDALPSVIFAAHDAQGNDLVDARVSVDGGAPTAMATLGVPMNPGQHTFTFHRQGAPDVVQQALLRAGEKNREIIAVFGGAPATPGVPLVTERPIPIATWVVAGVGVAGMAFFGTFGALGVSQRSADGCAAAPGCPSADKTSVDTKFVVADIALATGVVALGAAAWIYLARPSVKVEARPAAFFDFRPTPGGGVGVVGGRF